MPIFGQVSIDKYDTDHAFVIRKGGTNQICINGRRIINRNSLSTSFSASFYSSLGFVLFLLQNRIAR